MTSTGSRSLREPLCNYYSSAPAQLCKEIEDCVRFYPEIQKVDQGTYIDIAHCIVKMFSLTGDIYTCTINSFVSGLEDTPGGINVPIYLVPHGAFCDSGPLVAEAFKVRNADIMAFVNTNSQ